MVTHYHRDAIPTVYNLEDIPETEIQPGIKIKFFRGFNCLVGHVHLDEHTQAEPHDHPWAHEAILIMDGACTFDIEGETIEVAKGDMFHIPPDIEHFAETTSQSCKIFNCWQLREDYLPFTEYQTEFDTSQYDIRE